MSKRVGGFVALLLSAFLTSTLVAQQQPPQQPQGMGVSTGSALVSARPRTAGVTDPKAPRVFEDVTARTALASFRHRSGSPAKDYIFETVSGGCASSTSKTTGGPIYLLKGSTPTPSAQGAAPRAAI